MLTVKRLEFGRNNEKCTPTASCPLYVYVHILHKYMSILEHVQIHKTCVYNFYIYIYISLSLHMAQLEMGTFIFKDLFPWKRKNRRLGSCIPKSSHRPQRKWRNPLAIWQQCHLVQWFTYETWWLSTTPGCWIARG